MSADARLLVDLDLGPAHGSRLTAVSELLYYAYYEYFMVAINSTIFIMMHHALSHKMIFAVLDV